MMKKEKKLNKKKLKTREMKFELTLSDGNTLTNIIRRIQANHDTNTVEPKKSQDWPHE